MPDLGDEMELASPAAPSSRPHDCDRRGPVRHRCQQLLLRLPNPEGKGQPQSRVTVTKVPTVARTMLPSGPIERWSWTTSNLPGATSSMVRASLWETAVAWLVKGSEVPYFQATGGGLLWVTVVNGGCGCA